MSCSKDDGKITISWDPVMTHCAESVYDLEYNGTVLWKDKQVNGSVSDTESVSYTIPQEDYEPGTLYYARVFTETRSGTCTVTSDDESK